jgi:hypothetical protein
MDYQARTLFALHLAHVGAAAAAAKGSVDPTLAP